MNVTCPCEVRELRGWRLICVGDECCLSNTIWLVWCFLSLRFYTGIPCLINVQDTSTILLTVHILPLSWNRFFHGLPPLARFHHDISSSGVTGPLSPFLRRVVTFRQSTLVLSSLSRPDVLSKSKWESNRSGRKVYSPTHREEKRLLSRFCVLTINLLVHLCLSHRSSMTLNLGWRGRDMRSPVNREQSQYSGLHK